MKPITSESSPSPAVQDYLRAIYQLAGRAEGGTRVTTSQLADWLDVRPASVTAMLQKMAVAAPALIEYHKSHGARLTADGERAALAVVRSHRLMELYLHEKLGFGWDEVHEEADRLEHVISPVMADRISAALGHPTHDPHGHAIPTADLEIDISPAIALNELREGELAVICHVHDEDAELLRYLDEVGVRPTVEVEMIGRDAAGTQFWLTLDHGEPFALSPAVAAQIFITRVSA